MSYSIRVINYDFENIALNGQKRRRLHNEDHYVLYSKPIIKIRVTFFLEFHRWLPFILLRRPSHRGNTKLSFRKVSMVSDKLKNQKKFETQICWKFLCWTIQIIIRLLYFGKCEKFVLSGKKTCLHVMMLNPVPANVENILST